MAYTRETFDIARRIARDPEYRALVIRLADKMSKPTYYSNQRFDEEQHLASVLAGHV
jgi:hypothetical protein